MAKSKEKKADDKPKKKINSKQKGKRGLEEIWKPVIGFEGLYEVSSYGRVRSLPRNNTKGKVLKLYHNKRNGYIYCGLSKENHSYNKRVHVLIAQAFLGMKPNGFDPNCVVDHIDGDKTNNRIDNLELVSQKENDTRARKRVKQRTCGIKCIDLDSGEIFNSFTDAAKSVGKGQGEMVRRVCDGERSHYKNRHFARYEDYLKGSVPCFKGKNKRRASESLWR